MYQDLSKPLASTTSSALVPSKKVHYIDHVKVLLTILVVLHHAFITYGAPGGWYYRQPATNLGAIVPMTLFVATNQSFFMGLFFMLSAYFTEPSYNRKGVARFIADRLKRLGIPLLFYSFVLSPVLNFMVYRYGEHHPIGFLQYLGGYQNWIDFGVLWFVAALLLFTFVFVIYKSVSVSRTNPVALPSPAAIFLFAFLLGAASFVVRLRFPIGWVLSPSGFQFAHFPQYIALFCIGIIARRNNWLPQLNSRYLKRFGLLALVMVVVVFPLLFVLKGIFNSPFENFSGGWHWEALLNSLWEQITGISIIVFLLAFAKARWNGYSKWLSNMSRCAFGVYIFHPLFLIGLSLLVSGFSINPVIKLLIVGPLAVTCSFCFAAILVRIKGINQVI